LNICVVLLTGNRLWRIRKGSAPFAWRCGWFCMCTDVWRYKVLH